MGPPAARLGSTIAMVGPTVLKAWQSARTLRKLILRLVASLPDAILLMRIVLMLVNIGCMSLRGLGMECPCCWSSGVIFWVILPTILNSFCTRTCAVQRRDVVLQEHLNRQRWKLLVYGLWMYKAHHKSSTTN